MEAAEGWLARGEWPKASAALRRIAPWKRALPDVLRAHWHVLAAADKWRPAVRIARALAAVWPGVPLGWINQAHALHQLRCTRRAKGVLLSVVEQFPDEFVIPYRLACYECRLGNRREAWVWLEKARAIGGAKEVREMALEDPDLEPLWPRLKAEGRRLQGAMAKRRLGA